jgi:hypothetical protein
MERYCSTGQSPQRTVAPMEEEEENIGLHVSYYYSYSLLTKLEFSRESFEKYTYTKFYDYPSDGSRVAPC